MKKLLLVALLAAVTPFMASAQAKKSMSKSAMPMAMSMDSPTAKGKWLVGPALSISSQTDDDGTTVEKHSSMGFQPEVGYFISDNLSVGLSLGIGSDQIRLDGTATDKASSLYIVPTLRYYMPIGPKFQFLGKLQVPFGSVKYTLIGGNEVDIKANLFAAQITPAFAFFPSNKIGIELALGGLYFQSIKAGGNTTNHVGFDLLNDDGRTGLIGGPTLGVKWHLGK